MIRMGMKDLLLGSDFLWYCSSCKSCIFVCPQDVRFADAGAATEEHGGRLLQTVGRDFCRTIRILVARADDEVNQSWLRANRRLLRVA